jgi:hypothetical protein
MKSFLMFLPLLAACATAQPEIHSCPVPAPSPFQVIGEARMALVDSYDLMATDADAQKRVAILDYILIANFNFLVGRDQHYQTLAGCSTLAIEEVLPDMAIFASPDNTTRLKHAHEMFAAMGGTCDEEPSTPVTAPADAAVIERIIEQEGGEPLDLGPSTGDETPTSR